MNLRLSILALLAASTFAAAQTSGGLVCTTTAVPPLVHAEGVAERVGDIYLNCSGGAPNSTITTNLSVVLNTTVTNKIGQNNLLDATLDYPDSTTVSLVPGQLAGPNMVTFNGISIPVGADGTAVIRISNVRADATRIAVRPFPLPVTATLTTNGASLTNPTLNVAVPTVSLYGTFLDSLTCSQLGSPVPSVLTLANLLAAGSSVSTARITEGYASAFLPREAGTDNGTRIISRYSGFPEGARIFVPDVIAGSTADVPTSAGEFGQSVSGGQYSANQHELLLVRVGGADANGAGGTLVQLPGNVTATFGTYGEIVMANGSGQAVYEVVDSDPSLIESAQIPSFLGLAPTGVALDVETTQNIVLGPVSTLDTASATAPVPRFKGGLSDRDCSLNSDCDASYLPKLAVYSDPLTYNSVQNGPIQARYVRIRNQGAGVLRWNVSIEYKSGNDWLYVYPTTGTRNATTRVDVHPAGLTPGTYEATLIIDAGIGGRQTFPIVLNVTPPSTPESTGSKPAVTDVINAASYAATAFVRGSLGTIKGSFAGKNRSITFDGIAAKVLYEDDKQINFQIPAELEHKDSAQMVVIVDGVSSVARAVPLADAAPAIFNRGILNQDSSLNTEAFPAQTGSVIQIFATGLLPPEGGTVEASVGGQAIVALDYAGPAPDLVGVQQVNLRIPGGFGAGVAPLVLCNTTGGQRVCSPPVDLNVAQ